MGITDKTIRPTANHVRDSIDFSLPLAPAASSTNIIFGRFSPGFPFQILGVRLYGLTFTNVTSVDAGFARTAGGTYATCLNAQITPSADAEVAGVLSATLSALYTRDNLGQLIVKYTTGAGPAAVNAFVTITIRPRPLDGEIL